MEYALGYPGHAMAEVALARTVSDFQSSKELQANLIFGDLEDAAICRQNHRVCLSLMHKGHLDTRCIVKNAHTVIAHRDNRRTAAGVAP